MDVSFCSALLPSTNLSLYNIPSSINLDRMPDSSALSFGSHLRYLLFNCTAHRDTSDLNAFKFGFDPIAEQYTEGAPICNRYKESCTSPNAKVTCIELQPNELTREILLQRVLESLACSHFILGTLNRYDSDYSYGSNIDSGQLITGSIELSWTDTQCVKCEMQAYGNCIYDATVPNKFKRCECSNGNAVDFNKQTCVYTDICHGGLFHCNTGAKVGVGVAATVVVLGILVVIGVKCWRSPNLWSMIREGIRDGCLGFIKVIISIAINVLRSSLRKLQSVSIGPNISLNTTDLEGLTERPMEFSYSSIASATKSFGNLVGEGGFGRVYKGAMTVAGRSKSHHDGLSTEMQVAVKVLEVRSKHSKQQFLNEVITIGRIHHVNVVRLLGFCMQEDHEMLVYEYVANGSLDRWLFEKKLGEPDQKPQVLDWEQRYAIALGIARGLSYLHEECRHRTVHCDIKPHNILLDENMCPKIADFGLARLMGRDESKAVTFAKGTPGYMAPEFWMGGEGHLSTKFDVYSYGMVLLELVSGHRNFRRDAVAASECSSFPARAFEAVMEGDLESILDARLQGINVVAGDGEKQEQYWKQIKTAVLVALWCIQDQPGRRPWMSEVVKFLEGGAAVSECPPQPNISTFAAQSADPERLTLGSNYYYDDCTPLSVGR